MEIINPYRWLLIMSKHRSYYGSCLCGTKNGLLFKGGVHLENVGSINALAFDKTGTLTQGKPIVTDFVVRQGLNEQEVLETLASIESQSTHPLAKAISAYAKSH